MSTMAASTTKKVIIWIIVGLFLITTGLSFVLYFTAPTQAPVNENIPVDVEEYVDLEENVQVVTPQEDLNVDAPEDNDIQVVVTEQENQDEMTQTVEVALEDGTIETPTVGDFSDSLQLTQ